MMPFSEGVWKGSFLYLDGTVARAWAAISPPSVT